MSKGDSGHVRYLVDRSGLQYGGRLRNLLGDLRIALRWLADEGVPIRSGGGVHVPVHGVGIRASSCSYPSYSRPRLRFFFFQAEDGIRDLTVTGVQTCALPI